MASPRFGRSPSRRQQSPPGRAARSRRPRLALEFLEDRTAPALFTNPAPIAVADLAPADPYPSSIQVSGLSGPVQRVTVTLHDLRHDFPGDLDVLLVGPAGQSVVLLSDAGSEPVTNVTLTLDDQATAALPDEGPLTSGTFRPTDVFAPTELPPPAPPATHTSLAAFNGTAANGTWSLYVYDHFEVDAGTIAGGWSLNIDTAPPTGGGAEVEPNDTANTANGVAATGTVTGSTAVGAVDFFRFTLTEAGRLTVGVAAQGAGARLSLLDGSGRLLIQSDQVPGGDDLLVQHLTGATAGTAYLLRVEGLGGAGTYQLTSQFQPAVPPFQLLPVHEFGASGLAQGDFNRDGIPDLVATSFSTETAAVFLGLGDGTFGPPVSVPLGASSNADVVAADFTGDGLLDLAVTNPNANDLRLVPGNGDGTFRAALPPQSLGDFVGTARVNDFNRDGELDLAVLAGGPGSERVLVVLGRGDGTFQGPQSLAAGDGPSSLAAEDLTATAFRTWWLATFGRATCHCWSGTGTVRSRGRCAWRRGAPRGTWRRRTSTATGSATWCSPSPRGRRGWGGRRTPSRSCWAAPGSRGRWSCTWGGRSPGWPRATWMATAAPTWPSRGRAKCRCWRGWATAGSAPRSASPGLTRP